MRELEEGANLRDLAEEREELDPMTQCREAIMLGLRTYKGVDIESARRITGIDIESNLLKRNREAVQRAAA